MKYQYVIVQGDNDYFRAITQQTEKRNDAIVLNGLFNSKSASVNHFLNKVFYKINIVSLKRLFVPLMFNKGWQKDKPMGFIFLGWYANEVNNYLGTYLRKKYKNCKIICRFEDIIDKMPYCNFDDYKDSFDMLFTFDEVDAQKYGIPYYPSWYDNCDVPEDDNIEETDVFFVGKAKDRLPEIVAAYEKLSKAGLKCKFHIVGVPKEKRIYPEEIEYGEYMPYIKVLQHVKKTKCMLEILQKDAGSETLRVFEAINYNKKLITTNKNMLTREYYNPQNILYYEEIEDLDPAFVKNGQGAFYDDKFREMFKPYNMLRFVDNYLSTME